MNDLISIIQKAASNIYSVPRMGIIVSDGDPAGASRFLTQIPGLGWDTNETAKWCHVVDKKSYIAPRIGDYVIVQFLDGKVDYPMITGCVNEMKDMIPTDYQIGKDVLYEYPQKTKITYSNNDNLMEIGNSGFEFAARLNDTIQSTSSEDATYWAWLSGLMGVFSTWIPVPGDGGLALKTALVAWLVLNPVPTSLTGKITTGSDQVKIGDA